MKSNKQKIIELYETFKPVRPSYGEIAKKVGLSKARVYQIVQKYLKNKLKA